MNEWKETQLPRVPDPKMHRFRVTKVITETLKAWFIDCEGRQTWVPKTQGMVGRDPTGQFYSVDLPTWMAKEKLLIE